MDAPSQSPSGKPLQPQCISLYNIGIIDGGGVGILWFSMVRWMAFAIWSFVLSGRGSRYQIVLNHRIKIFGIKINIIGIIDRLLRLIPAASFLFTLVKALQCKDTLTITLVTWIYYAENGFRRAGGTKWPRARIIDYSNVWASNLFILVACGIGISYGGALRQVSIAGIVFALVFSCCFDGGDDSDSPNLDIRHPLQGLRYSLVFPLFLACIVTVIVRDRNLWIPHQENTIEKALFYSRMVYSSGAVDLALLILELVFIGISWIFKSNKKTKNNPKNGLGDPGNPGDPSIGNTDQDLNMQTIS